MFFLLTYTTVLAYKLNTVDNRRQGPTGCELLDGYVERLHAKFYVSATLSKKVLIFIPN